MCFHRIKAVKQFILSHNKYANPLYLLGRLPIFVNIFVHKKFGNLPISGKFCATEVSCNFESLPIFLFESSS